MKTNSLFLLCLLPMLVAAQAFTPRWYGRAETKTRVTYNSYLCELQIGKSGNRVTGTLNYYFGQQAYRVQISGVYRPQTQTIELNPFRLKSHFATNENSPDCEVDGSLTLYTDGGDSVLYGQINPVAKYRNMCPVLTIGLNKEVMPDPGGDPDLPETDDPAAQVQGNMLKDTLPAETILQPVITPEPVTAPAKVMPEITGRDSGKPVNPPEFNRRTFEQGPLIESASDTITLHLYDNGQVDNDTVTVYFNRKPVVWRQRLSVSPIEIQLILEPGENEVAMFADNLGHIPPNTALCLIFAAGKRYDINLESSFASNGTVRISRKKKLP